MSTVPSEPGGQAGAPSLRGTFWAAREMPQNGQGPRSLRTQQGHQTQATTAPLHTPRPQEPLGVLSAPLAGEEQGGAALPKAHHARDSRLAGAETEGPCLGLAVAAACGGLVPEVRPREECRSELRGEGEGPPDTDVVLSVPVFCPLPGALGLGEFGGNMPCSGLEPGQRSSPRLPAEEKLRGCKAGLETC